LLLKALADIFLLCVDISGSLFERTDFIIYLLR
jgi:hypothetical protein